MTRLLSLTLALVTAVTVAASEGSTTRKTEPQAAQPAAATTADPGDSPLVAAAKRTGRLGKKPQFVITNETLKESAGKGRVTTTTVQHPLNLPKAPEPESDPNSEWLALQKKREAERAAEEKAAAAREREKRRRLALAATAAEDGYLDDLAEDPAAAERRLMELERDARETPPNH